jgi:hypothetical protein
LNDPSLRQLKQRIALRCEVTPLSLQETSAYISGRLRIAGGAPEKVFTREAVTRIFEASLGIPRTISVLCDNAMLTGFAVQARAISRQLVDDVCRDFDLGAYSATEPDAPRAGEAPPAPAPTSRPVEKARPAEPALPAPRAQKRIFDFFS